MKKSTKIILNLAYWEAYLILLFLTILAGTQGFTTGPDTTYIIKLGIGVALIPGLVSFYVHYDKLYSNFVKTKKYQKLILFSLLTIGGSAIAGLFDISLFFGFDFLMKAGGNSFFGAALMMSVFAGFNGVMGILLRGFIDRFEERKLNEKLEEKNKEMELALVKSKLNPHFLFNTINNIDVLIMKDPGDASVYLNKLSEIMRFMLYETGEDRIQLEKELDYIHKYIALQKLRTSNEDYVSLKVNGKVENIEIAPMLFIPFIENAFKHASNKKAKHAIQIQIDVEKKEILFSCENKYELDLQTESAASGLGNSLIKKRLELLYPGQHDLEIKIENGVYKVILKLSL
jgi:hypothetical protein